MSPLRLLAAGPLINRARKTNWLLTAFLAVVAAVIVREKNAFCRKSADGVDAVWLVCEKRLYRHWGLIKRD